MKNILTIDVEDYFHVSAFKDIIESTKWDQFESRVEKNTLNVLNLLSRKGVKATFFILGWVAERNPQLVREIHTDGHEVACHGYSHKLIYEQTPEEFRAETQRAKKLLEDIVGESVLSYRAASYSITKQSVWALEILAQEGFKYDSSIFPIVHDRYGLPRAARYPFKISLGGGSELIEFPLSTIKLFGVNLPIAGGGYFRLFPYAVTRAAIRRLNEVDRLAAVFYLHPWEFDPEQPIQEEASGTSRFRHYYNLDKTESRFRRLLDDFSFAPLKLVAPSLHYEEKDVTQLLSIGAGRETTAAPGSQYRVRDKKVSPVVAVFNERSDT